MMLKRLLGPAVVIGSTVWLAACGYVSEYEKQVYDWEPIYCYKSIGAVQCYSEPKHSDSRRLVNYYGPAPSRYDKPDEPDYPAARAPRMIDYWVKDPEPIPQANPPKVLGRNSQPAKAEITQATPTQETEEDVSFMDGLMRSLFGKPQLANKPVVKAAAPAPAPATVETVVKPLASAASPLQPAPAAQPVIPVETGTL